MQEKMSRRTLRLIFFGSLSIGLIACSRVSNNENSPMPALSKVSQPHSPAETDGNLTPLFGRIWRLSIAPYGPASGAIYIFMPNGTLLETSCVETYRIATWTIDKKEPQVLRVVEDQQLTFTATITKVSDSTLRFEKKLVRGGTEKQDLTLTAVDQEFICPDLPK